jgi:hypothetical protein
VASRAGQERLVAAVEFKCDVPWSILEAIEAALRESER